MHEQKPQKWLNAARITTFFIALLLILIGGFIWVRDSLGSQINLFTAIFAFVGAVLALFQLIPLLKSSPPVVPQLPTLPAPAPIQPVHITNEIILPSSLLPSVPTTPVPAPPHSLTYRGMAQPPSTNPKTIQQRVNAVKEVYEKLIQPDSSALVLVGIGGLGKSTLAALVYNYVEQQREVGKGIFKRETLWLRVEKNDTFFTVAENIFTSLGNKPVGFEQLPSQSQAYALLNSLAKLDPPLLIVLDQFENLLNLDTGKALTTETGELLDALNSRSCPSRILLTSRPRPKGIRMTTYDSLVLYPVSDLTLAEGQALLKSRCVTAATENDLKIAVQHCNGHSFALCLLASLLDENKLSLSTLLNDPAYKQLWDKNVAEKLLAEIYKRLNGNQRELLHALSIYREAVPREAIHALISDATQTQLDTLLSTLQAQQLVQVVEGDRRRLHPIIATYAQNYDEQFNKEGMLLDHGKAAQYYIQQAEKKCPSRDERKRVSDVQPLIEAVWQFCQAEKWQEAYELMIEEGLFADLRRWGGNVILLELCQSLLSGNWKPELLQVSLVYSNIASVYRVLGQNQKAIEYNQKDLQITKAAGDRKGEGTTLNNLGLVYNALGQKQEALKYYGQALVILGEEGDRGREGTILNNLGRVYDDLGQKQEALKYYKQALDIRREVGNTGGEGSTLNNLGTIFYKNKRFDVALSFFILAKRIFVEVQSSYIDGEQEWIDGVHQKIGDQQFAVLLQNIEPHAQQIVDDALREV